MITINGVRFDGNNVVVSKGKIFIDGTEQEITDRRISITVEGNINSVKADACEYITATGNIFSVETMSGCVMVDGNITGNVKTMSGSVKARGDIQGSVSTMSGDIRYKKKELKTPENARYMGDN